MKLFISNIVHVFLMMHCIFFTALSEVLEGDGGSGMALMCFMVMLPAIAFQFLSWYILRNDWKHKFSFQDAAEIIASIVVMCLIIEGSLGISLEFWIPWGIILLGRMILVFCRIKTE